MQESGHAPPFPFHIWCIPPRYVGGEAYINPDAGGGAAQSSRRRCSVVLESCCLSACARVREHGLKRYVRARGGDGVPAWGFVTSQLGFYFSVGPGRRSRVGSSRTTVAGSGERGGRGRPMSPFCFAPLAPCAGWGDLAFAAPLLEMGFERDASW